VGQHLDGVASKFWPPGLYQAVSWALVFSGKQA
ncbi:uncharacterized protein METZ01_LOCUS153705, partial [marine metagenome]